MSVPKRGRICPADPFSDIDLALFACDPDLLLRDEGWIGQLGPWWTSHLEGNALGSGTERRVLFESGQDVDFAAFRLESLGVLTADPQAAIVLRRGFRILVNKDSVAIAAPSREEPSVPPGLSDFSNLVNDYWFHLVWAAKKLRRGELMTAVEATNGYLRTLLVRTVRWHALVRGPPDQDLWHGTRFFETWADPRVVRDFSATIARYDPPSVARALRGSRAMVSWLTEEISDRLSFPLPIRDAVNLSNYLDSLLEPW